MSTKPGSDAADIAERAWEGCYADSQGHCIDGEKRVACVKCIEIQIQRACPDIHVSAVERVCAPLDKRIFELECNLSVVTQERDALREKLATDERVAEELEAQRDEWMSKHDAVERERGELKAERDVLMAKWKETQREMREELTAIPALKRRIAELEAAQHRHEDVEKALDDCFDECPICEFETGHGVECPRAALSAATARPATATKEGRVVQAHTYEDGHTHFSGDDCAAPPSPAATKCAYCGYEEQDHEDNPMLRHPFTPAPAATKEVPTGVGDNGLDPIPSHAWRAKLVPLRIELVTFKDGDRWAAEVHGYTVDVDTGLPTRIRTRGWFADDPTSEDLHGLVTTWFDHELREQLGMKPHAPVESPAVISSNREPVERVIEAARVARECRHDDQYGRTCSQCLRALYAALAALDAAREGK